MDNKIISYSFFKPKRIYEHRFWDKHNNMDRYWYNIPNLIALNRYLYPDFKIKFHISENIKEHFLYPMLEYLEAKGYLEIEIMNYDYNETQPTCWRYKPLFNKECDILLCRDIDSLPTFDEYLSTKYFIENDNYYLTSIRSHTNHSTGATIMLAGLCGFRPKVYNTMDFNTFYNIISNAGWGVDQNSIINLFCSNKLITQNHFLDSPLSNKEHNVGNPIIPCISHREDYYRQNVSYDIEPKLIDLLDKMTVWAGEPIDSRRYIEDILSIISNGDETIRESININDKIRNFYA
jgi:hypothetical protein